MPTSRSAKTTTDHQEIRRWVESKGGYPAHVKRTGKKDDPGVLRIDFPGFSGEETLSELSWDEWFKAFDSNRLAFVYQPSSRFSKLVSRSASSPRRARTRGAKRSTTSGKRTAARSRPAPKRTKGSTAKRSTAAKRPAAKRLAAPKKRTKRTIKRTGKRSAARS
jgi:hypothetical protein